MINGSGATMSASTRFCVRLAKAASMSLLVLAVRTSICRPIAAAAAASGSMRRSPTTFRKPKASGFERNPEPRSLTGAVGRGLGECRLRTVYPLQTALLAPR